jgi:hypothetical protein
MKATIALPTRELAMTFATLWSRHSLRGYSMSASNDSKTTVTIYDITAEDEQWIDNTINAIRQLITLEP